MDRSVFTCRVQAEPHLAWNYQSMTHELKAETDQSDGPRAMSQWLLTQRTRAHYEQFPFIQGGALRIQAWARRLQTNLPELIPGTAVLDVGCGSGEVAAACRSLSLEVCAVDLTAVAVTATHALNVPVCQGDALHLPFLDHSVDHVVAIGVLHHTPDCAQALSEAARVSRCTVIVLLYSKYTPYHLLYALAHPLRSRVDVSWLERVPKSMLLLARLSARMLTGQTLDDDQLRRVIADQFWTPQASFHTRREVVRWAGTLGLRLVRRRRHLGYSGLYVLQHLDAP